MATGVSGVSSDALERLDPELRRIARNLGYERLLPVQEKAIPVIASGRHTLVIAPTGSGKTEAALLPVLALMRRKKKTCRGVWTAYITPLRALNRDILVRIEKLVNAAGFRVMVRHGDTTQSGRKAFLRDPPEVVVTTPESFNLMLTTQNAKKVWGCTRWVIVDEVHELLDSERGSELSVALERLEQLTGGRIQRIGLSATISEKTEREAVRLLAAGRLVSIVKDSGGKQYDIRLEVVPSDDYWVNASKRIAEIASETPGKILVFTNTRGTAELLASALSKILGADMVAVHHGSLSRAVRETAEKRFREGSLKVLVATSSMELGIDIGEISLVVQFLSPRSVVSMSQRAGRAGHRFGEVSRAVIVTSDNLYEILESGVIAFRTRMGALEHVSIHRNPLDVLAHQVAGITLQERGTSVERIYSITSRSGPFTGLDIRLLEEVVDHLDSVRVVRFKPEDGKIVLGRRTFSYFYKVSMIPDEKNYTVVDALTGSRIGELSERFIEANLSRVSDSDRFKFVLAGKVWEALDVDFENGRVEAKLLGEASGMIPSWEGELIPVDYRVAREVCGILSLCMEDREACGALLHQRKIEGENARRILEIATGTAQTWGGARLTPLTPVIEHWKGSSILYVCLGSKGNFALALLLSKILESLGVHATFDYIPYAIVFQSANLMTPHLVAEALIRAKRMDPVERVSLVRDAVRSSLAYLIRFLQVAKRMGVIDPDKAVGRELAKRLVSAYEGTVVEWETLREVDYDKLDYNALNEFLDNMHEPVIAENTSPSPLLGEVISNPYMRKDKAINLKSIALSTLIESFKKRVDRKEVILVCASCGHIWRTSTGEAKRGPSCPKCGSRMIAVLPATEWGEKVARIYARYKTAGRKPRGEAARIVKEVYDRAVLLLEYSRDGLHDKVVEALLAPGVGVTTARRILSELLGRGERAFYSMLFKAVEDYASNKKYWVKNNKNKIK